MLSYNLAYQEIISVHPTRRQIFAGKTDSTFWNIWQWVIPDILGLSKQIRVYPISGDIQYFRLIDTHWLSKLIQDGSGIEKK